MSSALAVTDQSFDSEVLQSALPVLVDFWADWCAPCKRMAPIIDEIATEQSNGLKVVKVDVDANSDVAQRYRIMSIPTLVLFKGGQEIERMIGLMAKDQIVSKIAQHL